MKREIEFRGKTAKDEWVFGDLVRIPNGDSFDCYIISDFDERDSIYDLWKYAIKVIPETVGQYTGLTDKNGKKVYVGNILQYGLSKGEVVFGEYGGEPHTTMGFFLKVNYALFTCEEDDFYYEGIESKDGHKIKVIGNIYETPELLNKIEYKGESDNGD